MKEFHFAVRIELTFLAASEEAGDGDCGHAAKTGGPSVIRAEPAAAACLRYREAGWPGQPASPRPETGGRQRAGLLVASRVGTFML